ncbi:hypothetical protein A0H81_02382 [Grifola frondosa]|uniref:Uncharacterized protein n=1 Tax=Grifola frondosa TaxID=5627 RepID=A0A1C7MLP0_GRIFR|nr:hypothetical protein A0H81_02382 [Grifola frondosa]
MDDEDEDDDAIINDELFRRIIANTRRKEQHGYRLSYAYDVGSSFDPDMEDVNEWETDLKDLEEEELATYAEEYDLHLEDLRAEDIFSLSDLDYYPIAGEDEDAPTDHEGMDKDVEMA